MKIQLPRLDPGKPGGLTPPVFTESITGTEIYGLKWVRMGKCSQHL